MPWPRDTSASKKAASSCNCELVVQTKLIRSFYSGSCNFIPCFDPNMDHWDS